MADGRGRKSEKGGGIMNFVELTMPLNHQWMPDGGLPTAIKFFLGPKNHQEKGMVVGSDSGTCLALPALFTDFRKTTRLDQVPVEKLFLRATTVAHIAKGEGEEINKSDVQRAWDAARPGKADALLVATGWGDKPYEQAEGNSYVLRSPYFSLEAAQYLARAMNENGSDLLLADTAVLGLPESHMIPEWFSMLPTPAAESAEARMYLHLYDGDKTKKDFAVDMEFARFGVMTVRKLIGCGHVKNQRIKIIVAPLHVVRGVASTCRVVAVEE
jgi:kynurenine formamidase